MKQSFPEFRKTFVIVVHFAETCSLRKMTSMRLRTEDRLDGAVNFVSWKARILLVLKENELWEEVVRNTTANLVLFLLLLMQHYLQPLIRRILRP